MGFQRAFSVGAGSTDRGVLLVQAGERWQRYTAPPVIHRGKCYHSKAVNRHFSRAFVQEPGHKHVKLTVPEAAGKPAQRESRSTFF